MTATHFSVSLKIAEVVSSTKEGSKRTKALKSVRWVFQTDDGQFACLNGMDCALTPFVGKAQIFDGRDNESLKARFWEKQLGQSLTATLI